MKYKIAVSKGLIHLKVFYALYVFLIFHAVHYKDYNSFAFIQCSPVMKKRREKASASKIFRDEKKTMEKIQGLGNIELYQVLQTKIN